VLARHYGAYSVLGRLAACSASIPTPTWSTAHSPTPTALRRTALRAVATVLAEIADVHATAPHRVRGVPGQGQRSSCNRLQALPRGNTGPRCSPARRLAHRVSLSSSSRSRKVLLGNHPNPFNPSTLIRYAVAAESGIVVGVYDVAGHHVRTLVQEPLKPGYRDVTWDGLDTTGRPVASGIYFVRHAAAGVLDVRKVVLLR